MGKIFFTSDLHFGHYNVIFKYDKRPFATIEEHDKGIIENWNKRVSKEDTVYILGDISWHKDEETANLLRQLNGNKILIKGNHDRIGPEMKKCFSYIKDYDEIKINNRMIILSHYPILFYRNHLHDTLMLYGHLHNSEEDSIMNEVKELLKSKNSPHKMMNVGCMHTDYVPISYEEICEILDKES